MSRIITEHVESSMHDRLPNSRRQQAAWTRRQEEAELIKDGYVGLSIDDAEIAHEIKLIAASSLTEGERFSAVVKQIEDFLTQDPSKKQQLAACSRVAVGEVYRPTTGPRRHYEALVIAIDEPTGHVTVVDYKRNNQHIIIDLPATVITEGQLLNQHERRLTVEEFRDERSITAHGLKDHLKVGDSYEDSDEVIAVTDHFIVVGDVMKGVGSVDVFDDRFAARMANTKS